MSTFSCNVDSMRNATWPAACAPSTMVVVAGLHPFIARHRSAMGSTAPFAQTTCGSTTTLKGTPHEQWLDDPRSHATGRGDHRGDGGLRIGAAAGQRLSVAGLLG